MRPVVAALSAAAFILFAAAGVTACDRSTYAAPLVVQPLECGQAFVVPQTCFLEPGGIVRFEPRRVRQPLLRRRRVAAPHREFIREREVRGGLFGRRVVRRRLILR